MLWEWGALSSRPFGIERKKGEDREGHDAGLPLQTLLTPMERVDKNKKKRSLKIGDGNKTEG